MKNYKITIDLFLEATDENDALGSADNIADYIEKDLMGAHGKVDVRVGDVTEISISGGEVCNFNDCQNTAVYFGVCAEHQKLED